MRANEHNTGQHTANPETSQTEPGRPMLFTTRAGDYYETAKGEERIGAHFGESKFGIIKVLVVVALIVGGLFVAFSYMFKAGDTLNDEPVDPNRMGQQLQMMRNAAAIAREAEANNRVRMEQMQRIMQTGEQFGAYDADDRFLPGDE